MTETFAAEVLALMGAWRATRLDDGSSRASFAGDDCARAVAFLEECFLVARRCGLLDGNSYPRVLGVAGAAHEATR